MYRRRRQAIEASLRGRWRWIALLSAVAIIALAPSHARCAMDLSQLQCANSSGYSVCADGRQLEALCITPAAPYEGAACGPCNSRRFAGVGAQCSTAATVVVTDPTQAVTLCSPRGTFLSCPANYVVVATCGGNNARCTNASICPVPLSGANLYFGMRCAAAVALAFNETSCEWRFANSDGTMGCELGEVMVGVCNGAAQGDCGGSPYASAVRCCVNTTTPSCAPKTSWKFVVNSASCEPGTALNAVCSVRCDPQGYFGFRANPGMFACTGWIPTQSISATTRSCVTVATCSAGFALTAVGQCYEAGFGAGTTATCSRVSFGAVSTTDCLWLRGNDNLWCPAGYVGVAVCAANNQSGCPGGFDTTLRCCRYSRFHNLGDPCPTGFAFSVTATSSAPAPYGADLTTDLGLVSLGNVAGVHFCDGTLYVSNDVSAVVYYVSLASRRANISMGVFGATGFTKSPWSPDLWSTRNTLLNTPSDVLSRARNYADGAGCASEIFVDSGNHIVREIFQGAQASGAFQAQTLLGIQSTTGKTFVNNSGVYATTLPDVQSAAYRYSDSSLYLTVAGAILKVALPVNQFDAGSVAYWQGNGVPSATATNAFRTTTGVWYPQQITIVTDSTVYAADYDGVSAGGGVVSTEFDTGLSGVLPGFVTTLVPYGVAYFSGATGFPTLFVTDRTNHALWRYLLPLASTVLVSAAPGTPGITDRVAVPLLQLRNPGRMSASGDRLFIVDQGNARIVQYNVEAVCATGYDPVRGCQACSVGYFGYPRCVKACDIDVHCSSSATFASGDPNSAAGCTCSCQANTQGASCSFCKAGRDPRFSCSRCLYGYRNPNCASITPTVSMTLRETGTARVTTSKTITPPPTRTASAPDTGTESKSPSSSSTVTLSVVVTSSWSPTLSLSRAKSRTKLPTRTHTRSKTQRVSGTTSLLLTPERTASETPSKRPTPSITDDTTLTATRRTKTLLQTQTWSMSLSLIATRTRTLRETSTASSSYALIPPVVFVSAPITLSKFDFRAADQPMRRVITLGISRGLFDSVQGTLGTGNCTVVSAITASVVTSVITTSASSTCTTTRCLVQLAADPNAEAFGEGFIELTVRRRCIQGRSQPAVVRIPVVVAPHDPFVPLAASAATYLTATVVSVASGWLIAGPALLLSHSHAAFYTASCSWGARILFGLPYDVSPTQLSMFLADADFTGLCINSLVVAVLFVVGAGVAHFGAERTGAGFIATLRNSVFFGRFCGAVYVPLMVPSGILATRVLHDWRDEFRVNVGVALVILWLFPTVGIVVALAARFDWTFRRKSVLRLPPSWAARFVSRSGDWQALLSQSSALHLSNFVQGFASRWSAASEFPTILVSIACAGLVLAERAPDCSALIAVQIGVHSVRAVMMILLPANIGAVTLGSVLSAVMIVFAHVLSLLWSLETAGDWSQTIGQWLCLSSAIVGGVPWLLWLRAPYQEWRRKVAEDVFNLDGSPVSMLQKRQHLDDLGSSDDDDDDESAMDDIHEDGRVNPLLRVPRRSGDGTAWQRIVGSSSGDSRDTSDEESIASGGPARVSGRQQNASALRRPPSRPRRRDPVEAF